jgi:hypothetical protein
VVYDLLVRALGRQEPAQAASDGARLTRCGDGAWVADRELRYGRRAVLPIRMAVIADPPAALTLYSPVDLDEATVEALAGLGEVHRIIVPNRFHTLFARQAITRYAEAEVLVPPGLADWSREFDGRLRLLEGTATVGDRTEVTCVRLRAGLEELVVYNDRAELLMVADLLFNLQHGEGLQRFFYRLNGVWRRPALSRAQRLMLLKDRESLGAFYRWAMGRPFSQISMGHGQLITRDAREIFYRLFHRYGVLPD